MERKKPLIAVPIGDPAGVGPEIAGKGIVSEISMAEAILLAAKYAPFFARE